MKPELKSAIEAAALQFYAALTPIVDDRQLGELLLGMAYNRLKQFGVTRDEVIKFLDSHWKAS